MTTFDYNNEFTGTQNFNNTGIVNVNWGQPQVVTPYSYGTHILTTGTDNLSGGSGNDLFSAWFTGDSTDTLQSSDTIDGGGGQDILELNLKGHYNITPTIKNIERVNIVSQGDASFDAANLADVETLAYSAGPGSQQLYNLGTGVDVELTGAGWVINNSDELFVRQYLDTTIDQQSFTLNNASGSLFPNLHTVGIEEVSFQVDSSTSNNVEIDVTNVSAQSISVSGGHAGGTFYMGRLGDVTTDLDASGFSGNLVMYGRLNSSSLAYSATGGAGNDFLAMDGTADSLDGGSGNDTLYINASYGTSVMVDLSSSSNQLLDASWFSSVSASAKNFESVDISDMTANSLVMGSSAANKIYVGKGDDYIDISEAVDAADTIVLMDHVNNGIDTINGFRAGTGLDAISIQDYDTTRSGGDYGDNAVMAKGSASGGPSGGAYYIYNTSGNTTDNTDVFTLDSAAMANLANADLDAYDHGFGLFRALCTDVDPASMVFGIKTENAGDEFYILAYDGDDAHLFHCDAGSDNNVDCTEVTRMALIMDVAENSLVTGDIVLA